MSFLEENNTLYIRPLTSDIIFSLINQGSITAGLPFCLLCMTTQRSLLNNIVLIRPVLIFLLVFYHAFAIYGGNWDPIDGYPKISVYWWLDNFSYAFMLEAFVLVSGYVFGYQVRMKGECKLNFKNLAINKFKRLMIPCFIFSILYIAIFNNICQPIGNTVYEVICGAGHMWFLPMLFWCFIIVWIIEKTKVKPLIVFILLLILSFCSFKELPLRLNITMYYMPFFYAGYIIQRKNINVYFPQKTTSVLLLVILFILLFTLSTWFRENAYEVLGYNKSVIENRILVYFLCYFARILQVFVGLFMLFSVTEAIEKRINKPISSWVIEFGSICMGVYLIQQFILKWMYYYTELPLIVNPYCLPWLGFIVAFSVSVFVAWLLNKTNLGRIIIG